jgi:hypothetical protein
MTNKKQSINGVQTRIVKSDGIYYPQFSTDGLIWFPLWEETPAIGSISYAIDTCEHFTAHADCLPDQGEIVWASKK